MKLSEVRIQNLRGYADQTVTFNDYTCLVGPNGAGKSTVLCALCIFFRDTESYSTNLHCLQDEDFHCRNTAEPVRITVTFVDLTAEAQLDFKEYFRHGKLVVTAEAKFDAATKSAVVTQCGQRLVMRDFRAYFAADNDGKAVAYLKEKYREIRGTYPMLPDVSVKAQMAEALHAYENEHSDKCELRPSSDQFYGFSSGANRLAKYVQWVYIPAVKDASTEQTDTKSSALGKLLARSIRSRVNFADQIASIRGEVAAKYLNLIAANQPILAELSASLGKRLKEYAHHDTNIQVEWVAAPERAIRIDEPAARIVAGEGSFNGELSRFGHGLQRCYLLALLQELTDSGSDSGPRLILGCDEPELHQHPPQARHLGDVFTRLSEKNTQVIVSTHSPHLVSGDRFSDIRLVRKDVRTQSATVSHVTIDALAATIGLAKQVPPAVTSTATLRMRQALLPSLNELFFSRVVVLVEGLEDIAYITAHAELAGKLTEFRQLGCHLIAVEGKGRMLHPLAITQHLGIPTFAVFDADSGVTRADHRTKHEGDNRAILRLRGHPADDVMPSETFWSRDTVMWATDIGTTVKADFGEGAMKILEAVRVQYAHDKGLEKSTSFIHEFVNDAWLAELRSSKLDRLIGTILEFARQPWSDG